MIRALLFISSFKCKNQSFYHAFKDLFATVISTLEKTSSGTFLSLRLSRSYNVMTNYGTIMLRTRRKKGREKKTNTASVYGVHINQSLND